MPNTHAQSTVAAVGFLPTLKSQLEKAKKAGLGWKIAAIGVGFLGAFGLGASFLMERQKNRRVHSEQLKVLSKYYRFQIASTLGINPEKVTVSDLKDAAAQNVALQQAIQKVESEKSDANRGAAMSSGGSLLLGGMIPGVSGIAKIGVDVAGGVIGGVASDMMTKDVLHVNDMVEHIDAKVKSGEAITTHDIVLLRVSQDLEWQKRFKSTYGTAFHKMSEETQKNVLATMPQLINGAEKEAYALNNGLVSPQSLVMTGPASNSNFAGVATRQQKGSFVNAENVRRMEQSNQLSA